jgi:hypothetical protein
MSVAIFLEYTREKADPLICSLTTETPVDLVCERQALQCAVPHEPAFLNDLYKKELQDRSQYSVIEIRFRDCRMFFDNISGKKVSPAFEFGKERL